MAKRSGLRWAAFAVAAAGLLAAGAWAGRATLAPQSLPGDVPATAVTAQVTEQTVGRQLTLNVTVEQEKKPIAANALTGVVTQVRANGDDVRAGDVLYRVADVPVRAVAGTQPFYRALSAGAKGEDVRQLQGALVSLKLLGSANGTFGDSTTQAVKRWQKKLGVPETGTVALGELIAVAQLPSRLLLDSDVIAPGVVLAGGEKAVLGAVGEPSFVLPLSEQQTRVVPESATITVPYQGRTWGAVVASTESGENGEVKYRLTAPDGGPVCGGDCAVVATGQKVSILSKVAIVAPATGPAVPVGAITTRPDGSAFVTVVDAAGGRTERAVTVVGSQDGVAVVEGVTPGETVQVLAAGR